MAGVHRLEGSPAWQRTTLRAGKRFAHRPACALPAPQFPEVPFGVALSERRSPRRLGGEQVSLAGLSALLFATYGVTRRSPDPRHPDLRAAPSAGALYPLDVYLAVRQVESLSPGLYHYDPGYHVLADLGREDAFRSLSACLIDPERAGRAAIVVLFVACFRRSRLKYGLRAYRFILLEAGHAAQNLLLASTALGLAALPIGGFFDRQVEDMLAIDGVDESPLYLLAVGSRVREPDP